MLATLLVSVLAGGAGVAWTHDYTKALVDADEQRRPVLLFFRKNCGGGNLPVNPIDAGPNYVHQEGLSPCDRMQDDIWENAAVIPLTKRFVPVLIDSGDATLEVRYQATRMPTTLIADPWGNEIFRVTGYLERDKMARILRAVPGDFSALATAGRALKANPTDLAALMGAARYYQENSLPQVSEHFFEKAAATAASAADISTRRQVALDRGLNLLLMGKDKDAAATFDKALAEAPSGAGSDALLLGLVNAHLQGGRRKDAQSALARLEKGWPGSAYALRARQLLDGGVKR